MHGHEQPAANVSARAVQRTEAVPELTIESARQHIEESFEACKQPPQHPTKPHLQPVEVMPVLPHVDRWGQLFVTVTSRTELVTEADASATTTEQRAALLDSAMLRCYVMRADLPLFKMFRPWSVLFAIYASIGLSKGVGIPTILARAVFYVERKRVINANEHSAAPADGQDKDMPATGRLSQFMAMLLPKERGAATLDPMGEGTYTWAREFGFQCQSDADTGNSYALTLTPKGALYVPVQANYILTKRKHSEFAHVPIPRSVRHPSPKKPPLRRKLVFRVHSTANAVHQYRRICTDLPLLT
jgi:hypothetical protein